MRDNYTFYTYKLNEEYSTAFKQIEFYLNAQYIDDITKEDQLGELLDTFLNAQEAGKPVSDIVGNNPEHFCRLFCSGFNWKDRIVNVFDILKTGAWILLLLSIVDVFAFLVDYINGENIDFLHTKSSTNILAYVTGFLSASVIGWFSGQVAWQIMMRKKQPSIKKLKIIKAVAYIVSLIIFIAILLLLPEELGDVILPIWASLLLACGYLILYHLINKKRLSETQIPKVRFRDMVAKETEKNFSAEMEKKFNKVNKRYIKKGKEPLTLETFLEKEEKDCNKTEKLKWLYYLFPVAITGFFLIIAEFETGLDIAIFLLLMLTVEYGIMLSFWQFTKFGVKEKRKWIEETRQQIIETKTEHIEN